ncbi:DUF2079 domain-containing protein [Kovacikia minuta CCNUW1]|uniref:DUF2079 domain-containing protein n=1 Tax=Kovacikia minuta TaxID=2931930 RepID=UPI001CCA5A58|nr:DUF2079 domain-containing protein [Kovacikia minuta]UBF23951.1 DUF2079 domain-containing protein [Kovacikia minuta CCNUW1]
MPPMDHGLFNQLFWNNLHRNFFQSSLTGGNSAATLLRGSIPPVSFVHLGQHFVIDFLLWLPIYALFPSPITLIVLQVSLITVAGIVLYTLARHYLQPRLALMVTASYYGAGAVIGPTFANFYEQCQIPLFAFGMLLALEKQRWWFFWVLALLVLGIREDAGFITFSIGLYWLVSRRHPRVGILLCLLSFVYVTGVTNFVMPLFSKDVSQLYLSSRFKQFVPDIPEPSTLQVLWGMLTQPRQLLVSLFTPFDRRFFYLMGLWLPLAFVPVVSPAAWLAAGVPMLSILVQTGTTPFVLAVRYALSIVPGLFYGTILWWSVRDRQFPRFRRFWVVCIALSIIISIVSNPNRAFSFLIPDSVQPWVHVSLFRQWEHASHLWNLTEQIPDDVSVSTTSGIIPQLSGRREILRLPQMKLLNDQGQVAEMEYLLADFWLALQYPVAFRLDLVRLRQTVPLLDQLLATSTYGILDLQDGVVLMRKGVASNPEMLAAWKQFRQELVAALAPKN